jgi:hypothetical protein
VSARSSFLWFYVRIIGLVSASVFRLDGWVPYVRLASRRLIYKQGISNTAPPSHMRVSSSPLSIAEASLEGVFTSQSLKLLVATIALE